jgi:hypothetical protein
VQRLDESSAHATDSDCGGLGPRGGDHDLGRIGWRAAPEDRDRGGRPQIWFSFGDDLNVRGVVAHPDFLRLFDSPSPWPTGLTRMNVMQLRSPWFLRMPPETDQNVVDFLKQHNIALAVPFGFVDSETCGQGIEGLGSAREHNVYVRLSRCGYPRRPSICEGPSDFTGWIRWQRSSLFRSLSSKPGVLEKETPAPAARLPLRSHSH